MTFDEVKKTRERINERLNMMRKSGTEESYTNDINAKGKRTHITEFILILIVLLVIWYSR